MNKLSSYFGIGLCSLASACQQQKPETDKPNIIYILADDLGYGDVSIYNPQGKIKTPHIDRLASEGMRFTDAHSPSGVSTPTRYGIMTGNYCWRSRMKTGVLQGYGRSLMEHDKQTVASLLQEKGYSTAVIGKWHLGLDWQLKEDVSLDQLPPRYRTGDFFTNLPPEVIDFSKPPQNGPLSFGFDYSFILPASLDMEPYCYLKNDTLTAPLTDFTEGNDLDTGFTYAFWRQGLMSEDFDFMDVLPKFTRKAIKYINDRAEKQQPFFLYFPLPSPHTPWLPTDEFIGKSDAGSYGDFVIMTDHVAGQIMEAVKLAGIEDNTIIILTSDNGPYWRPDMIERYGHRSAGDFRGMKADIWDGGHRVPFIVKWNKRVKAGSVSNALTSLTNLMATVADIVGMDPDKLTGIDSYSILPVLLGKSEEVPNQEAIIHHSSRGHFAVRTNEWKLVQGKGSGGMSTSPREEALLEEDGQLFNMKNDPSETNNMFETRRDIVENLSKILEDIKNTKKK